jgi:hypothetical protein
MSVNKKLLVAIVAALTLGVSSCRKFLDVNENPNIAQNGTMKTVLPAAQLYLGSAVGVDLQIYGALWSGYWTQSPNASQYRLFEQYNAQQDAFSTAWENLYIANSNFFQLGKLADSMKNKSYKAVSLLMRAYAFQLLTDAYGDIPFTEALRGQSMDSGIISPKYDSQAVVYRGIVSYIDSAISLIDSTKPGTSTMAGDDLIYGGDLDKWKAFGNTLKLKIFLRLSNRQPVFAEQEVTKLINSGADFIVATTSTAQIKYGSNAANRNPLYAEAAALGFIQNLIASSTVIDSMNANADERVTVLFSPISNGTFQGLIQGFYQTTDPVTNFSVPSAAVGGDASRTSGSESAPVKFITGAEGSLLLAEAAARGWGTSTATDAQFFTQGIQQSYAEYGILATDYLAGGGYWTLYPVTGTLDARLEYIITQKWFAMCGNQSFEAWTEYRRTGYPTFNPVSFSGSAGRRPMRFLYPTSESTRNAKFPGLKLSTERVWWDLF